MRQRWILLLAGGAVATVVVLCAAFVVLGYFVARDVVASLPEQIARDENAPGDGEPSTAPASSGTLLEDDFSDPDSGWYTFDDADVSVEYADGAYRFVISAPETGYWETHRSVRLQHLQDVRIEADVQQRDGHIDDTFGLVCRAADDRFYAFDVSPDGWYAITKVDGDNYTTLAGPPDEEAPDDHQTNIKRVRQEPPTYRLRADCIGDTLTLYLDGEQIAQVHDDAFRTGTIGVSAYNNDAPRTEVHFDNVVVRTP